MNRNQSGACETVVAALCFSGMMARVGMMAYVALINVTVYG